MARVAPSALPTTNMLGSVEASSPNYGGAMQDARANVIGS
jgi:hypothetical protein